MKRLLSALLCTLLPAGILHADVRLPAILGPNMVVQRDVPIHLWGWADAGETVTVRCGDFTASVQPRDGRWEVRLPARPAGACPDIHISGRNTLVLGNLLAGDVWVCSGQSNMVRRMTKSVDAKREIAAADHAQLRLFEVMGSAAQSPREDLAVEPKVELVSEWLVCTPKNAERFSAVAFFFGRDVHQATKVPIGLIFTARGGTVAEAWMPRPALEANPRYAALIQKSDDYPRRYPARLAEYEQAMAKWRAATQQAVAEGKKLPSEPRKLPTPEGYANRVGVLYNAMIHPLTTMPIKGAVWYQGESNAERAEQYRTLLPDLIASWRQAWNQPDLPFGIVQLANFKARPAEPEESDWAELREAQALTAATIPHCGLAVAIDVGDEKDIHPADKRTVGQRMALWAIAQVYDQSVVYSGPVYDPATLQRQGDTIRVGFKHIGSGLAAKDNQPLKGFAIAGADRRWHWTEAKIEGNRVVVRADAVTQPLAVRYAWATNPECNLYNKEGLPAVPFRTDNWPLTTQGR